MNRKAIMFVLALLLPAAASGSSPAADGFILGVSQGASEAIPVMRELGIKWGRMSISWNDVTPGIEEPFPRLDDVIDSREAVIEFSRGVDWTDADRRLRYRLENGITPIPIIGSGWHTSYPRYKGAKAHPEAVGPEHYLAFMYIYVRSTVERYDGDGFLDAEDIVIKLWQTENELNQAGLTAAWGWRDPTWFKGLRSSWNDWDWLTRLLGILYRAVHDADPEAITYMNFHTDIHPRMNRLFGSPHWEQAVRDWKDLMDVIGFDAYPNYYTADPVRGEVVGERVARIKELAPGKKVMVIEVDYPYAPAVRGFSPEKQARFLGASYEAARQAGADGYFKFRVMDPGKHEVDITEKDLANLEKIVPWYEQGKMWRLLFWALPRYAYVRDHFLDVLKSVEGNWGVIDQHGNKLPAYYVLEDMVEQSRKGRTHQ